MDAWLIAYDITADKLRDKTHNRLIYCGFTRVQFSVFMGTVEDKTLTDFIHWFKTKILTLATEDCSLVVVPLSIGQVKATVSLGTKQLDYDDLTGEKHTLII
jgi:CRISPR-associated endonuclease Cas2